MNSMNDDINLMTPSSTKTNHCNLCHEEFDYRDDVKTAGNHVKFYKLKKNKEPLLIYIFKVLPQGMF